MTKSKSVQDLVGTYDGLTLVKSRAYGEHVRAARGTHKKAKVNKAFKVASKRLMAANAPAKILKDALAPHLHDLEAGSLWGRLVSAFHHQLRDNGTCDFSKLRPLEIDPARPFSDVLSLTPEVTKEKKPKALTVRLPYVAPPNFRTAVDSYQVGVVAVFPGPSRSRAKTAEAYSETIPIGQHPGDIVLKLEVPSRAKTCVLFLTLEAWEGSGGSISQAMKRMRLAWAGVV